MKDLFETVIGSDAGEPRLLAKHLGFEGTLPVTWAAAGGVLFGGFAVAVFTLTGRLSGAGLFVTAGGLFVLGSIFGFVHGAVLAYLGRNRERTTSELFVAFGRSVLFSVPVVAVAWAIAGWIALTDVAVYLDRPLPLFGAAVGWLLGIGVILVAVAFGSRGFRQAFAHWPDARPGTTLVFLGFVALVVTFLFDRPDLWWTGRAGTPGPVILAGGVTVWLIGPVVTFALWARRELPGDRPTLLGRNVPAVILGVALGLAAGGIMGFVIQTVFGSYGVLPLALWSGPASEAILIGFSQGLLDEILLRLLVVLGLVWAVHRWAGVYNAGVVGAAIFVAGLVHVALYLPSLLTIGFPSTAVAVGYGALAVFVPALIFGALFWWRGLGATVVAHAATIAVAAMLVS